MAFISVTNEHASRVTGKKIIGCNPRPGRKDGDVGYADVGYRQPERALRYGATTIRLTGAGTGQ